MRTALALPLLTGLTLLTACDSATSPGPADRRDGARVLTSVVGALPGTATISRLGDCFDLETGLVVPRSRSGIPCDDGLGDVYFDGPTEGLGVVPANGARFALTAERFVDVTFSDLASLIFTFGAGRFDQVAVLWTGSGNYFKLGPLSVGACTVATGGADCTVSFVYVRLESRILPVAIDIKPGSDPNTINLGSGGSVSVAIFSTPTFDATTVHPWTVTLADAGVKLRGQGQPSAVAEDVNGDGLLDLVVHVETSQLQLTEGDAEAVLSGITFDGTEIRGSDTVRILP